MAAGALTEQAVETVANNLETVAEVTREVSQHALRYFFGGVGLGGVLGFVSGYKFTKEKIRAEVMKEAEAEIKTAREFWRQKAEALNNEMGKARVAGKVEGIVEREGYVTPEDNEPEVERKPVFRPVFPKADPTPMREDLEPEVTVQGDLLRTLRDDDKSKNEEWDYTEELRKRENAPSLPYVIHQDEFSVGTAGYTKSVFTYYSADEVLVDEKNTVIESPAKFVGMENLEKFGHGTDDWNVVFIRNNSLRMEIEVVRLPDQSYEEHVLGLSRDDIES